MRVVPVVCLAVIVSSCGRSELDFVRGVDAATDSAPSTDGRSTSVADAPSEARACSWGFAPAVAYNQAPGVPFAIAVGDFNDDGHPDLAVAHYASSGSVGILLNRGDGSFRPQVTYAAGDSPVSIAVVDFNGDGHPDLVVANSNDNTVSVLYNSGDGSFRPQVTYAAGQAPDSLAVGDFNGDGLQDLAAANAGDSAQNIEVWFNAACCDDNFGPPVTYAVPYWPSSLVAGAFKNGAVDLAYANQGQGTVNVMLNAGVNGALSAPSAYLETASAATGSIAVGDFNADGLPDIVAANSFAPGNVVVMVNEAATFNTQVTYATGAPPPIEGNYGGNVAVGDFNADHHPDIAVTNGYAGTLGVLLNDGTGAFGAGATYSLGRLSSDVVGMVAADFNGDGADDIATANGWNDSITVLLSVCE
jgi:hypothetical protein